MKVQDLKAGNISSICVVKDSMLYTFMTSCLRNGLIDRCVIKTVVEYLNIKH